jgi:hypothetical protein
MVLDAGALIALERSDRALLARLREASAHEVPVIVPIAALAQVWRGGPRQALLARAQQGFVVASFDDRAHRSGELCGLAATSDVVDASVAITAAEHQPCTLFTSDPDDLAPLLRVLGAEQVTLRTC